MTFKEAFEHDKHLDEIGDEMTPRILVAYGNNKATNPKESIIN
jgi:hypothetical protein